MKISEKYGPQFDPIDGTVGEIQLVKRWAVINKETGFFFGPTQGRCTKGSEEEARAQKEGIEKANSREVIGCELDIAEFWCWPNHFDPVGRVIDSEE